MRSYLKVIYILYVSTNILQCKCQPDSSSVKSPTSFDAIEENGRLIEQQTDAIEKNIRKHGRDIDSPEAEYLIRKKGEDVDQLADKMDELVEQRGKIVTEETGSRHSQLLNDTQNNDVITDRVQLQSQRVDKIGELVEKVGDSIEHAIKRFTVPQPKKSVTHQVGRLSRSNNTTKLMKIKKRFSTGRKLRKSKKLSRNNSIAPDSINRRYAITELVKTIVNRVGHLVINKKLMRDLSKSKRTLYEASSSVENDRKVIVPVERKKLNKLMIFYYMKKRFPQFVRLIEKQISTDDSDNPDIDETISDSSEEFLAKNEDKIKTIMAEMLADKYSHKNSNNKTLTIPSRSITLRHGVNISVSNVTSINQTNDKKDQKQIEKKTGRDLINQTFEDDELAEDETNNSFKESSSCLPSETRCVVKGLISLLKDIYLKPKSVSNTGVAHDINDDPYSEIGGLYGDNKGGGGVENNQIEEVPSIDSTGFNSFLSANSFANDGKTSQTSDSLKTSVEDSIKQLVESVKQTPNNKNKNWRQDDVDKKLQMPKSKPPAISTEAKVNDASELDGVDIENETMTASRKVSTSSKDVLDDDEITEKLQTLSNVIGQFTSLASKQNADNAKIRLNSDDVDQVKSSDKTVHNITIDVDEYGSRKNTRLKYHNSQKSISQNKITPKVSTELSDVILKHRKHKETPTNKWRNYHPPPTLHVSPTDETNAVEGPDGKPFVHRYYSDHPTTNVMESDDEMRVDHPATDVVENDDEKSANHPTSKVMENDDEKSVDHPTTNVMESDDDKSVDHPTTNVMESDDDKSVDHPTTNVMESDDDKSVDHPTTNVMESDDDKSVDHPTTNVMESDDENPADHPTSNVVESYDDKPTVTNNPSHEDDAVELLPDDIPDVTSQLIKAQQSPYVSHFRNMNIVPREVNIDDNARYRSDKDLALMRRSDLKKSTLKIKREKILKKTKLGVKKRSQKKSILHRKSPYTEKLLQVRSDPYISIGQFPDLNVQVNHIRLPMVNVIQSNSNNDRLKKNSNSGGQFKNFSMPDSKVYEFNGNIHPGLPHLQDQLPSAAVKPDRFYTDKIPVSTNENENKTVLSIKEITPSDDAIIAAEHDAHVNNNTDKSKAYVDFSNSGPSPASEPVADKPDSPDKSGERLVYMQQQHKDRGGGKQDSNNTIDGYLNIQDYLNRIVHQKPFPLPNPALSTKERQKRHLLSHFDDEDTDNDDDDDFTDGRDVARLSYLTEKYGEDMTDDINDGIKDVTAVGKSIVEKVTEGARRVTNIGNRVQSPRYDRYGHFYKIHDNDDYYDDDNDEQ